MNGLNKRHIQPTNREKMNGCLDEFLDFGESTLGSN